MTSSLQTPPAAPAAPAALKFDGGDRFLRELKRRVDAYFERAGRRRDCPRMYFKTATILAWFAAAYLLLLFAAHAWWVALPLAVILGLSMAAIGFNIQHDGGHKAYSERRWVNTLMAFTLDILGGSSYFWDWKHNSFHHTYTNVAGYDDNINIGVLGRLSPQQPRYKFHRLQSIYIWLLYGFVAMKWNFFDDFHQISIGRVGSHKIPRPRGGDLVLFIAGKVVFFTLAFVVPMLLHSWWKVLIIYAVAAFSSGMVFSVVSQLAHCLGEADFPTPELTAQGSPHMEAEWAVHQVQTTVDFARSNPFMCWYLGGLNFQIEHHLFRKVCHVHYPALSKVVEETCRDFGIRYAAHRTFFSAVAAHFRWLVVMGRPPLKAQGTPSLGQ